MESRRNTYRTLTIFKQFSYLEMLSNPLHGFFSDNPYTSSEQIDKIKKWKNNWESIEDLPFVKTDLNKYLWQINLSS